MEKRVFTKRAGGLGPAVLAAFLVAVTAPSVAANEFTIQGAMETVFVPLQMHVDEDGESDAKTALGVFGYSPNGGARFKLMINASLDRMGLISYLRFYTSGAENRFDTIWLGAWIKPLDWLRVDVGSIEDWTLWGKFGQFTFAPYTQRSKDEDALFTEFYYPSGVLVTIRPTDKLFIGAGLPALKSKGEKDSYQPSYSLSAEDAEKAYERFQGAVGYTFEGIGLARLQYVGANPAAAVTAAPAPSAPSVAITSSAKIEGAFAYTGIPGLLIDAGVKIPIAFEQDGGTFQAPYQVSGAARVRAGQFTVEGRADGRFGSFAEPFSKGNDKINFAPEINMHLTPSYTIDSLVFGLDCGLEWYGETTDSAGNVIGGNNGGVRGGLGVFVRKNFGPSAYVMSGIGYHFGGEFNSVPQNAVFTIPIIFNYTSPKASLLAN